MISFDHRTKIKTKNKNVFYSTPVSLTSYTNYHIPLQALCSIQNNFLPLTHYFTYSHYSFFTLAISSAFKNFLFLPHEVDSYLLFRFQLSYHFPSYHFFIQLLWLGQIPYYIFIVPLASPSMYFWEPRGFFYIYFWNYFVNSSMKICKLQQSRTMTLMYSKVLNTLSCTRQKAHKYLLNEWMLHSHTYGSFHKLLDVYMKTWLLSNIAY